MDPLALYGNAKDVIEIIKSIKDRCVAIKQNLPSATLLIHTYQRLAERLNSMSDNHHETIARFSVHDAHSVQNRLSEIKATFSSADEQLRTELTRLEKRRLYRIIRAKHTELLFSALQQDGNNAKQKLDDIQDMLTTISSLIPCSDITDRFRHCNTAPPNETNIVLDLETLDDNGIPLTCEGRLKAAILTSSDGQSVGAVASGMGGVGKSCALRALGHDPDIVKRFPDAICFISLGMDATVAKLMERLCSAVEATGGKKLAEELSRETDLPTMIEKARNWFCDRICLFMIDDLWCSTSTTRHGIKRDILGKLSILASSSGSQRGSRLVYSTRDESLSSMGEVVHFEPRDYRGTASTNILLQCAEAGEDELHHPICEKVIGNILDYCAGLPVALNISGKTVRWKKRKWNGENKETWIVYWNALPKHGILDADTLSNNYQKIGHSLGVSLDFLDQDDLRSFLGISFREIHRALCVIQKQDWISSGVLRTLCGIKDDALAIEAIEAMGRVGLVDEEHRLMDEEECVGLRLHDLVLDFARKEAEKSDEVAAWHAKLPDNTLKEIGASQDDVSWPILLPEKSYVFRNICRLLQKAGRGERVWSLLLSAEWIVKMTQMGYVRRLEEDVELCTNRHGDDDKANSLRMVGKAVRLSASYCIDEPDVVWFQLFSRLLTNSKRCDVTWKFLERVKEHAPKPWLRPTRTCVKSMNDALIDTFEMDGNAGDVGFVEDEVFCCYSIVHHSTVWEVRDCDLRACDFGIRKLCSDGTRLDLVCRGDSERDLLVMNRIISSKRSHELACFGRAESGSISSDDSFTEDQMMEYIGDPKITLVAIGRDCRYAVTANSSGLVRTWNISTLRPQGEPDNFHEDIVQCVAISSGGKRAVSCSGGSLRIWNGKTGKQEVASLTTIGRQGWDSVVSISENGNWIASIREGGLHVWDAESKSCLCVIELNGFCSTTAITENGKKVVCGVKQVMTVFDVEKGQIEQELGESNSGITSIILSFDGTLVVSGSVDGAVRVFDIESGRQVAKFKGHTAGVTAVSIGNDKKRVVSISKAGSVCVWNAEVLGETCILPDAHEYMVLDVAICADGRYVVSQDLSNMLVWYVNSGDSFSWAPPIPRWSSSVLSITRREDRIVCGSKFGRVRVWKNENAKTWRWPLEMGEHSYREHYFTKDPVGIPQVFSHMPYVYSEKTWVVSIDEGSIVRHWNINAESPVLTALPIPTERVSAVGLLHNFDKAIVAVGLKGGNILLWKEGMDSFEHPLVGHTDEVCCLQFYRFYQSNFLVSGAKDKSIIVWEQNFIDLEYSRKCPTMMIRAKLVGHTDRVCCLAISHDQRFVVSGSDDTTVRVWNIKNMEQNCPVLTRHTGSVCCVAINRDGEFVVSGSNDSNDRTVCVWDVKKGTAIHCIPQISILSVGISQDAQEVMCVSKDNTVRWWDVESGKRVGFEVGGHMGEIQKLAANLDGNRLAVLSCPTQEYKKWNPKGVIESPQVRVWDLENMQCVYVGAGDEWENLTRGFVIDAKRTAVELQTNEKFRVIEEDRRYIAHGERKIANFQSNILSFDVDYKNNVVAAGGADGSVAIFKIV